MCVRPRPRDTMSAVTVQPHRRRVPKVSIRTKPGQPAAKVLIWDVMQIPQGQHHRVQRGLMQVAMRIPQGQQHRAQKHVDRVRIQQAGHHCVQSVKINRQTRPIPMRRVIHLRRAHGHAVQVIMDRLPMVIRHVRTVVRVSTVPVVQIVQIVRRVRTAQPPI